MSKPREFWITKYPNSDDLRAFNRPCHEDIKHLIEKEYHVIEKSAYIKEKEAKERVKEELKFTQDIMEYLYTSLGQLGIHLGSGSNAYEYVKEVREEYQKTVKQLDAGK